MGDSDDIEVLNTFFQSFSGQPVERAWRRIRASLLRAKRISSSSLPSVGDAALHLVQARERLAEGRRGLAPGADLDRHFEAAYGHLVSGIDAISEGFRPDEKEEYPTSDSIPPPPKKKTVP